MKIKMANYSRDFTVEDLREEILKVFGALAGGRKVTFCLQATLGDLPVDNRDIIQKKADDWGISRAEAKARLFGMGYNTGSDPYASFAKDMPDSKENTEA